LRPYSVTHYKPAIELSGRLDFNSSSFLMRYLNRTIYRSAEMVEGEDNAVQVKFLHWLRNKRVNETEAEKALREEFNLRYVYPEETFYRTYKITQKDLLTKLRDANEKDREKIILELFSANSISGRRGVTSLN